MNFINDMQDAASDYAADLRKRGYLDIGVFRYDTSLDNREPYRRDHLAAAGWAVRYTSGAELDLQAWAGSNGERKGRPVPKFHDRSVTLFTAPAGGTWRGWLRQGALTRNAGILADFAGEGAVPMYTAAWSPPNGPNSPLVPDVILKRFPVRDGSSYPFKVGPTRMYHLIMTPSGSAPSA